MPICLYCGETLSSPIYRACCPEHEAILRADDEADQALYLAESGLLAMYNAKP